MPAEFLARRGHNLRDRLSREEVRQCQRAVGFESGSAGFDIRRSALAHDPGATTSPTPTGVGATSSTPSNDSRRVSVTLASTRAMVREIANCFPMAFGYYVVLERTLFCESVSDEELRLWNINVEVYERGLEPMIMIPEDGAENITGFPYGPENNVVG